MHLIKHAADGKGAKSRDEDAVRLAPVRLEFVVGGEEAIMDAVADVAQGALDCFFEAALVAALVDQLLGIDDNKGRAGES